ncbi:hypothetical protein Vadar_021584 [Vaccinium darrowii]|uniref:Uncharacterized protein n=1 Tax=Vaccinium darrowii TaxID=229202 RepID=A0ACB7YPL9_9ERIC|nr:hypothetical protein Vadar_021584 [Vaccinium darrowii]
MSLKTMSHLDMSFPNAPKSSSPSLLIVFRVNFPKLQILRRPPSSAAPSSPPWSAKPSLGSSSTATPPTNPSNPPSTKPSKNSKP